MPARLSNLAPVPMPARPRHRHLLLPLPTVPLNPLLVTATVPPSNSLQATLILNSSLLQHMALLPLDTNLQMHMAPLPEECLA